MHTQQYKYYAFISYSRKDSRAAAWLQRKFERLRFPVKLVMQEHRPLHPKFVRPIYRDTFDLEHDDKNYWDNIKKGLDQSRYLVVLCSPDSSRSVPVNDEVRHFLANHDSAIESTIPVILRGSVTSSGPDGCLCPALKDLGSQITSRNLPKMAPEEGSREVDGWMRGFIGTAACMLHLESKSLSDHVQRMDRQNAAVRWAVGTALAVLVSLTVMQYLRIRDVGIEKMNTQEANARLQLQKGKDLCNAGDPGRGVLWLNESLQTCPPSAPGLQEIIRTEMSSASLMLHHLDKVFAIPGAFVITGFSPDGKPVLISAANKKLMQVDHDEMFGEYLPDLDKISIRALRPDGKMFATSNLSDGEIVLTSLPEGKSTKQKIVHSGAIRGMTFHPNGSQLLVAAMSKDGKPFVSLQTYGMDDAANGLIFDCQEKLNGAAFSKDGRQVVAASQANNAQVFDALTGKAVGSPMKHPSPVFAAAFSPDGRRIVTGCLDGVVRVWKLANDGVAEIDTRFAAKHTRAVRGVSFSNSGKLVLSSSEDGTARVWDASSGQAFGQPLRDTVEIRFAFFSPDDQYVLAGGWKMSARLWKLAEVDALAKTLRQYGAVESAAFSLDGKLVVTGCQGSLDHVGVGTMWDARTGAKHGAELSQGGQVKSVAFSPDGKLVATAGNNGSVKLWRTADGEPVGQPWVYGDVVAAVAFSNDNRWLALTGRGNRVLLIDLAAGRVEREWRAFPEESGMYAYTLKFSKDSGSLLVGGSFSGRVFTVPGGQETTVMTHSSNERTAEVLFAHPSPDEKIIITGGINKKALLWSASDGRQPLNEPLMHDGFVLAAAFTIDGQTVATASSDGTVKLWSVATGKLVCPELSHNGWVQSVAFNKDSSLVVTGCDDGIARLWRTSDGSLIGAELHHDGPVIKVMFSPTDQTILTTSQDGTARLWTPPSQITGKACEIEERLEVATGQRLLENHTFQILSKEEWLAYRESIPKK